MNIKKLPHERKSAMLVIRLKQSMLDDLNKIALLEATNATSIARRAIAREIQKVSE